MPDLDMLISVDMKPVIAALRDMTEKHLKYANALALTRTAVAARDGVRAGLPRTFKIKRPWTAHGIRSTMADRRAPVGAQSAKVGTIDAYTADHAIGRARKPKGRSMLIQSYGGKGGRGEGGIRSHKAVRAQLQKRKAFSIASPGGTSLAVRVGKRRKIKVLAILRAKAMIKKHWPLWDEVLAVVGREWGPQFIRACAEAIRPKK